MGVHEFWKKFIFDNKINWRTTDFKNPFSLLVDANGMLYTIANDVYGLGDKLDGTPFNNRRDIPEIQRKFRTNPDQLEMEFMFLLKEVLTSIIINVIDPSDILIIAIDGIPPVAKANQQRARRYRSALERKNNQKTNVAKFDTLNFTVGTVMMKKVCDTIQEWIVENRDRLPKYVRFSHCGERGEGEHKIFRILDNIKEFIISENYELENARERISLIFSSVTHVVLGADSDLCFLSMLEWTYKIIWIRKETDAFNRNARELEGNDISEIRKFIVESMGGDITSDDTFAYIIDFTLMSFIIGDDFVPAIFAMSLDSGKTLVEMMNLYREFFSETGRRLAPNGDLDVEAMSFFFRGLVGLERVLYEKKREVQTELTTLYELEVNGMEINAQLEKVNELKAVYNRTNEEFKGSGVLLREYDDFVEFWRFAVLCPSWLVSDAQGLSLFFREKIRENFREPCLNYLTGLKWNLKYYLKHQINDWYYQWLIPPTIHDISIFLDEMPELPPVIKIDDSPELDITQLLCMIVNPILSEEFFSDLIPKKKGSAFIKIATKQFRNYSAYTPSNFNIFEEGMFYNPSRGLHGGIVLIPPMPLQDLKKIQKSKHLLANFPEGQIFDTIAFQPHVITSTGSRLLKLLTKKSILTFKPDEIREFTNLEKYVPRKADTEKKTKAERYLKKADEKIIGKKTRIGKPRQIIRKESKRTTVIDRNSMIL